MIRWLAAMLLAMTCAAQAQTGSPVVKAELSAESTLVGQPLILRVTVLVPTWLPSPPQFPSMEAPNLIVRLPERASGPVSESIDGETWSGVSRSYRIYPMVPGPFRLPQSSIAVTYADPDTRAPIDVDIPIDPVVFTSVVPEGAEGLDPLILAEAFTLEQTLEGADSPLAEGDAITRTVRATITGTSALFIPPLVPAVEGTVVRAYPKDPIVQETEDRGTLSGTRSEVVSYVAQYGGTVDLPSISIDWFNTGTNSVETATVDGAALTVDAPAEPIAPKITPRQIAVIAGALVLGLLLVRGVQKYVLPPLKRLVTTRRSVWHSSERFAAQAVRRAIDHQDLSDVHRALAIWSERCPGADGPNLEAALTRVGQTRYGAQAKSDADWAALADAFQRNRDQRLEGAAAVRPDLPPLNPV